MKQIYFLASLFLLIGISMTSCSKDDDTTDPEPEPEACATWDADIQEIVALTCAYEGCHSGAATASSYLSEASNDYTSYAGIKANLDNGNLVQRALVDQNMPNAAFVPDGNPDSLTTAQIDLLQCWADAGYPEN